MREKTKEDVFEELLESYAEVSDAYADAVGQEYYAEKDPDYRKQFAVDRGGRDKGADWIAEHADDFARAWVLEAWKVEETGKVVRA